MPWSGRHLYDVTESLTPPPTNQPRHVRRRRWRLATPSVDSQNQGSCRFATGLMGGKNTTGLLHFKLLKTVRWSCRLEACSRSEGRDATPVCRLLCDKGCRHGGLLLEVGSCLGSCDRMMLWTRNGIEFYNDFDNPGSMTCTRAVQGEDVQITVEKYEIITWTLSLAKSNMHACWVHLLEPHCQYKLHRPAFTSCSSLSRFWERLARKLLAARRRLL